MSSRSIDFAGDFVYDLSNFAIVGNRVYLEAPRGSRAFGGDVGGELYVLELSTGAVSKLLAYGDEDNGGYLFSSEGHLYRVYTSTTDYIVRGIDQSTGRQADNDVIELYKVDNFDDFDGWKFAMGLNSKVYWCRN